MTDDLDKLARGLSIDQSVNDIPDAELLGRAVRHCRPTLHEPRWSIVSKRFGLGSTYSVQLCRRFGMDPEERRQPRRRQLLKVYIERTTHAD